MAIIRNRNVVSDNATRIRTQIRDTRVHEFAIAASGNVCTRTVAARPHFHARVPYVSTNTFEAKRPDHRLGLRRTGGGPRHARGPREPVESLRSTLLLLLQRRIPTLPLFHPPFVPSPFCSLIIIIATLRQIPTRPAGSTGFTGQILSGSNDIPNVTSL